MRNHIETVKGYRILEELSEIFLPAHVFVVKDFFIDSKDCEFILSDDSEEQNKVYLCGRMR